MFEPVAYSKASNQQYELNQLFLDYIRHGLHFNKSETVLDVGCGTGRTTANQLLPILPEYASVIAVDFPNMIEFAKNYNPHPRITYKSMNIEDKHLKDKWNGSRFDKAFSFFCEQWVMDHSVSFSNYHHLLKPGGRIYMMFADYNNSYGLMDQDILKMTKWQPYSKGMMDNYHVIEQIPNISAYYQRYLEEQHFHVESIELKYKKAYYTNSQEYSDFNMAGNLVVPYLPENLVADYMEDYKNLSLKHGITTVSDDGEITTNVCLLYIKAVKKN